MNCLDNFIGIPKECYGDNPPNPSLSGLYITDLPGISIMQASLSADHMLVSATNLFKQKIDSGYRKFALDLNTYIFKYGRYQFNQMQHKAKVGKKRNTWTNMGLLTGVDIGIDIFEHIHSPFLRLRIKSITILNRWQPLFSGLLSVPITIEDNGNTYTYTLNFPTTPTNPQQAVLNLDYLSESMDLRITYTGQANTQYNNSTINCNTCGGNTLNYYRNNSSYTVKGWDGTNNSDTDTFGMCLDLQLECDFNAFVCDVRHIAKDAILYRCGIEVIEEMLYTDRTNFFTLNEAKRERQLETYKKTYEELMISLVTQLTPILKEYEHNCCFKCRDAKFLTYIP